MPVQLNLPSISQEQNSTPLQDILLSLLFPKGTDSMFFIALKSEDNNLIIGLNTAAIATHIGLP